MAERFGALPVSLARRATAGLLALLLAGAGASAVGRELPREPATRDPVVRARWLVELGDAYLENGAVAKSCRAYDDAVTALPAWWLARLGAVRCGRLMGRPFGELLAHLEAAEEAYPLGPLIHLQKGVLYEDHGDLEPARAAYRKVLSLAPQMREARRRLADLAIAAQDWAGAQVELEALVDSGRPEPIARTRLADVYVHLGATREAAKQLEEVARESRFRRGALVRLARLYESLGDTRNRDRVRGELDGQLGASWQRGR